MSLDVVFVDVPYGERDIAIVRTDGSFQLRAARSWPVTVRDEDAASECRENIFPADYANFKGFHEYVVVTYLEPWSKRIVEERLQGVFCHQRAWLDLTVLSWPLVQAGLLSNRSLGALASYLQTPKVNAKRTAEEGASAMVEVYRALMQRYKFALSTSAAINELAGGIPNALHRFVTR